MLLLHVKRHDLLKDLIERHVGVRHDERALLGEVVIEVRNDLHGNVRLARSRRTDNQCQPRLHARPDRFDLHRHEAVRIH